MGSPACASEPSSWAGAWRQAPRPPGSRYGSGCRPGRPLRRGRGAGSAMSPPDLGPSRDDATAATVRVLVADDQKVVREGLVSLLSLLPGVEVVGAALDGDDAVRQALVLHPDVVLMDLNMPRCNGVEATERLRAAQPQTGVVV